jgi:nucleotide-binding universal stress UspA family protein
MPTGYARILVPVDFSPSSHRAVREAAHLVRAEGELVLLHVLGKFEPALPFSKTNRRTVAALARRARADATAALREIAESLPGRVRTRILAGVAHEEILAEARRVKADAIVIGVHGNTLSDRLLMGSTTERVVRKARIPVVVTPAVNHRRR